VSTDRAPLAMPPATVVDQAELRRELQRQKLELDVQNEALEALREELEATRERYRELYDLFPIGYVVSDVRGILEGNTAAERLLGVSHGELLGRPLSSFVVPEDVDELLHHERSVQQSTAVKTCEIALLAQDGVRHDVRLDSARTAALPGQWRTAIFDVSAQRRLERQLVDAARRDAIGPVARGLAHDVCHILNSILNDAERLQAQPAGPERVRLLSEQIKALALHGGSVVQSVLERARADSGVREIADLNEIVLQAEAVLKRIAGEGVRLRLELRAQRPWVTIGRSEIEQVLSNLVSNARDAMSGRGELSVETHDAQPADELVLPGGDQCAVLSVRDGGVGMNAATQARVFDPYFTTKAPGHGSGLGLPTVYNIVKAAGGEVRVRSAPGRGTTMDVYLPRQGSLAADQRPSQPMRVGLPPTKVLVVESDLLVGLATSRVLEQAGYEVLRAQSGREALAALSVHADSLKLVVSHAELPDGSGPELVRALRAVSPTLRTVLTTDQDPRLLTERGPLPHGTEVLRKPFGHGVLVDRVRRALAASKDLPLVLVVDDDAAALAAYEELLAKEGFRVVCWSSAAEALDWFVNHAGEAAVLVTDLHLAGADGGWLARELRGLGEEVPILFLTGAPADDPLLRGVLSAPKTALLTKPAETSRLAVAVRRLIAG
jgi:two-component system, cell cycle sensor histidine kinase and response regulator CckA